MPYENMFDFRMNFLLKLTFLFQYERQMEQMRLEHARELKIRDDKIVFLKKQISDSLKDNSWERQQQIEELTKQLKRTHDEYEILRQKLLQYQNKKGV